MTFSIIGFSKTRFFILLTFDINLYNIFLKFGSVLNIISNTSNYQFFLLDAPKFIKNPINKN